MSTIFHNQHFPAPATSLVGRRDDLARLTALLARPEVRLVTMLGTGGVGKTRLALQFATDIAPNAGFDVHLVLLAATTGGDALLPAIARAHGLPQLGATQIETLVIDAIGDSAVLLVLDNAERVAADLGFLPRLLAGCPGLKILVTSQVMLRLSAEHIFPVEPLPTTSANAHTPAPASQLFVERALAVRPDLDLSRESLLAIDDIVRQIDGLPLAIELAAARTRFISPTALRDRLSERLHLLVGGPRDAPERQRTLRATLTWAHDLLSPDERVLFRRLSIFEPGAPFEAIGPVCNAAGDLGGEVEEILASLADHSLIRMYDSPATGRRVRLLNIIREFAREQLQVSDEEDAVQYAHATWFARHVTGTPMETWRTGTESLELWMTRNLPDVDNFSLAIAELLERDERATVFQLVAWLVPFWMEIGQMRESTTWTHRVMPFATEAAIDTQTHFFRMASAIAMKDDNLEEADAHAAHALRLAEQVQSPRLLANCQNLLGQVRWRRGLAEEGEQLQRSAIATAQAMGDPLGGALFACQIAESLIEEGEIDRAEPLLREAIPVVARERPGALPILEGSMGYLLLQRGLLDAAGSYFERALAYHLQPPHRLPSMLAGRLLAIAELALRRDHPREAGRLIGASLAICHRLGIVIDQGSQSEVDRLITEMRASLDADQAQQEIVAGKQQSMIDALTLAVSVSRLRAIEPDGRVIAPASSAYELTPREREVLALLVEGRSNPSIAGELFISERTVTTHLSRLYAKLDVSTRAEAIALAMRAGIIDAPAART